MKIHRDGSRLAASIPHTILHAVRDAARWLAFHSGWARGPTRLATPSTAAVASIPALLAARITANASRFSSVAPVACAISRPSVAVRVIASGQATIPVGTRWGVVAPSAADRTGDVASFRDHGLRQVAVAAHDRGRHQADAVGDHRRPDGWRRVPAPVDASGADEHDAFRTRQRDRLGRADGGVDGADTHGRQGQLAAAKP